MAKPELSQVIAALNRDGFLTRLVPPDDEAPVQQLLVLLGDENEALTWRLEMMLLPEVEEPIILQFFALLPFEVNGASVADLARFILVLNGALILTGFGLSEANGWVFYRHLMPCLDGRELDAELVLTTLWTINYQLDRFAPLLKGIAEGTTSLEQSIRALEHNLERWQLEVA